MFRAGPYLVVIRIVFISSPNPEGDLLRQMEGEDIGTRNFFRHKKQSHHFPTMPK